MRSRLLARREPAAEALAETLFPPQFSLRPWRAQQEAPVLSTPVVSTSRAALPPELAPRPAAPRHVAIAPPLPRCRPGCRCRTRSRRGRSCRQSQARRPGSQVLAPPELGSQVRPRGAELPAAAAAATAVKRAVVGLRGGEHRQHQTLCHQWRSRHGTRQ